MSEAPKKIYIRTFGCQMNDYDSERMYRLMEREGWQRQAEPEGADLIVVNTCSVREKAEHKALSEVGMMRKYKAEKPGTMIALAGCVAQQMGETLLRKSPDLDLVFGTHAIDKLPALIENCAHEKRLAETSWDYDSLIDFEKIAPTATDNSLSWKGTRASGFVPIMRGCDKHCTFCIVPQTRGKEVSRPIGDIVREVRDLVDHGVKDVTLLGQIVNRYGRTFAETKAPVFHELLDELAKIEGIYRLRFTSSHPTYITPELITRFRDMPQLASHVHLPVQSGSDRLLKTMRRGHKIDEYLDKVRELREARPGISITTDLIVGYPGETEDEFELTLQLIRDAEFDSLYAFKYSPRPNTPAENEPETLTESEKSDRLARLFEVALPQALARNKALVGKSMDILVEGESRTPGRYYGRTACNRMVYFPAESLAVGDVVAVRIDEAFQNALAGTLAAN
ncbi:MAG: tRNA (N6-isopentenyl adenosine(37)-C2)-methylthiotransferase MiaB [Deltaproteobacteria bacterium]|nr:tRNA (N6-isopentenyl adenosine(37)-C2)-methylthiotransferase MiaB [Deltaproteobacteria bacterium]